MFGQSLDYSFVTYSGEPTSIEKHYCRRYPKKVEVSKDYWCGEYKEGDRSSV